MKKILQVLGLIAAGYAVWIIIYPSTTLRVRVSVEVETPEGLQTGSSVQEVQYRLEPCPICNTSGPKFRRYLRGEAVVVDLGSRGKLFALLSGGAGGQPTPDTITPVIVEKLFGLKEDKYWRGAKAVRALARAIGKADVPAGLMPFMVRFRDIDDPKTIERVDPNNLVASFGPGVKLINATIEIVPSGWWPLNEFGITGTPLTTGIEKQLVWLPSFYGKLLDGDRVHRASAENRLANSLGSGNFKIPR